MSSVRRNASINAELARKSSVSIGSIIVHPRVALSDQPKRYLP